MIDFFDAISAWARRMFAMIRDPAARERLAKDARLVFPLSVRQLKRSRARSVFLALVVCLAVALHLVASAATRASIESQGAQAEKIWAPAEIILYGPNIIVDGQLRSDLASRLGMRYSDVAVVHEVYTSQGAAMAIGTTFPVPLFAHVGLPSELIEDVRDEDGVGLFPKSWGYKTGDRVWLGYRGDGGWQDVWVKVRGVYEDPDGSFSVPLVARTVFTAGGVAPNGWLGYDRNPYLVQRSVLGRLGREDHLMTQLAGETMLTRMSSRAMGPVRVLMGMGALLAVLGVFNLLLLAFLRRKRQLGTLKALGMESSQIGLLLTLEGAILSGAGLVTGWILGTLAVALAARELETTLEITWGIYVGAALMAALVFAVATWMPVRLAKLASVDQLLHARRVYVNPNPSCTNCGRCGGF